MKNMKRWKRLMAVGLCSAMMFSMSVGVSATETQKTDETAVETEKADETAEESDKNINKGETILQGDSGVSGNVDDEPLVQADGEELEEVEEIEEKEKAAANAIETQADGEELPEMEFDSSNIKVSHEKKNIGDGSFTFVGFNYTVDYTVELPDGWQVEKYNDSSCVYIDGILTMHYLTVNEPNKITISFRPSALSSKPHNVICKIDLLKHYSNGEADGVAKNKDISFSTEVVSIDHDSAANRPYPIPTHLVYDGTQDLVFKLNVGTGDWAVKEINEILIRFTYELGYLLTSDDFTYDAETGEVEIPYFMLNELISKAISEHKHSFMPDSGGVDTVIGVDVNKLTYQNGKVYVDDGFNSDEDNRKYGWTRENYGNSDTWTIEYAANKWSANGEMPEFIDTSYEFDGTQDMVFNFKNGTGDNAIKAVKEVLFPIQEQNAADENGIYLQHFRIGNYGTSFNYDISKGQVTLFKHAVSAIVYGEYTSVSNVYGGGFMVVELANGQTRTLYAGDGDANWSVKILEKSPEAAGQHRIPAKEGGYTVEDMQTLVDINKEHDVVIYTPEGAVFTFAKGTMRMIDGKDNYPLGVEIIADFSHSGIKNTNVTSSVFACRINFEYSGELPGTAKISIPVDKEWNGQTLYYYQVMEDGTLKYTGKSGKVENSIFEVFQSHCSDYVLLAKSPKELGVTENTGSDNNTGNAGNTGNNNNQSGAGGAQGSTDNSDVQFKPVDTTKTSPRTGDNNMILLFVVVCVGSCIVGVSALKARRRTR